jgi:thymidylate synthase (FAD)
MNKFEIVLDTFGSSPSPQRAIWEKQHFCVSEDHRSLQNRPDENRSGEIILDKELKGNRGHWSVLDQAFVSFNCYGFPHSVMVQIRTHAASGLKVLAQSGRYTGNRFLKVVKGELDLEDVFYFSPTGSYHDRQGNKILYTEELRNLDKQTALNQCEIYASKVAKGFPFELARESSLPYNFIQEFGVAGTLREIFHILDVRSKRDAEYTCQEFSRLLMVRLLEYCPELADWYLKNRYGKAITSP